MSKIIEKDHQQLITELNIVENELMQAKIAVQLLTEKQKELNISLDKLIN